MLNQSNDHCGHALVQVGRRSGRIMVLLGLLCGPFISTPVSASDPWTSGDVGRESVYQVLHAVDYLQTREIARHPEKYYERNPILGNHPSEGNVALYFAATSLLHLGVAYALPRGLREPFQYVTILIPAGMVAHNFGLGIKIQW